MGFTDTEQLQGCYVDKQQRGEGESNLHMYTITVVEFDFKPYAGVTFIKEKYTFLLFWLQKSYLNIFTTAWPWCVHVCFLCFFILLQKSQKAQQLLAQASKALAESISLCLQHNLSSSILAGASLNMLECHGQSDPAVAGQYLALLQVHAKHIPIVCAQILSLLAYDVL